MNIHCVAALSGIALLLNGCATASANKTVANAPAAGAPITAPAVTLARGVSGEAVRAALGEPEKIEPVRENPAASLWTYRRPVERKVRTVEPSMQSRTVFDPTNLQTGMATVQVPVQQTQEVVVEEVLVLIIENDRLADWRRSYREVASAQTFP
jgi:hypothetical protein